MGRKKNPDIQLYYALVHGNIKRIKNLVFNEGVCVNHVFMDGSFPLHVAAERGFVEEVTFLLSMKASTDMKNKHGQTALMLGIGYPPIVKVSKNVSDLGKPQNDQFIGNMYRICFNITWHSVQ